MSNLAIYKPLDSLPITQQFIRQVELKTTDTLLVKITKIASLVLVPLIVVGDLIYKSCHLILSPRQTKPSVASHSWRSRGITTAKFAGLFLTAAFISFVIYKRISSTSTNPSSNPSITNPFLLGPEVDPTSPLPEIVAEGACPLMETFENWNIAKLLNHKVTEGVSAENIDTEMDRYRSKYDTELFYNNVLGHPDLPSRFSYVHSEGWISACERNTPIIEHGSSGVTVSSSIHEVLHAVQNRFRPVFEGPIFEKIRNLLKSDYNQGFAFSRNNLICELPTIDLLCHQTPTSLSCEGKITPPECLSSDTVWQYSATETKDKIVETLYELSPTKKSLYLSSESDQSIPKLLNRIINHFAPLRKA